MTPEWRIVCMKQVAVFTCNVSYSSDKKGHLPFYLGFYPIFSWTLYQIFSDYSKFI